MTTLIFTLLYSMHRNSYTFHLVKYNTVPPDRKVCGAEQMKQCMPRQMAGIIYILIKLHVLDTIPNGCVLFTHSLVWVGRYTKGKWTPNLNKRHGRWSCYKGMPTIVFSHFVILIDVCVIVYHMCNRTSGTSMLWKISIVLFKCAFQSIWLLPFACLNCIVP